MRRYIGIIIAVAIVLLVLIALNAVSFVQLDRPEESESEPNRSSYNTGPTGTRAFYQLLEDAGYQVARWRNDYRALQSAAAGATLIMIGPGSAAGMDDGDEAALETWLVNGGRLVIISRQPQEQFSAAPVMVQLDNKAADEISANPSLENLIDKNSDVLIAQPTAITRDVRGLEFSRLATRLQFQPPPAVSSTVTTDSSTPSADKKNDESPRWHALPQDEPAPPPPPAPARQKTDEDALADENTDDQNLATGDDPFYSTTLTAPVVHLGDSKGAVLADFDYGKGRVILLTDPFVVANNGLVRGSNLTLALNLINGLGGRERQILFDEAIHGYQSVSNPLFAYFRGTPVMWIFGQMVLIALLIAWSAGRRFARPLPLPQPDRHSPLEFVGSMANLQQAARARDLALENIYPRFKTSLCRRLGLSVKSKPDEIASAISRRRLKVSAAEVRQTMLDSERALAGAEIDDQQLLALVATMRQISAQLK